MKKNAFQKRKGYFMIGGAGLLGSALYLGLSFQFPFGEMDQPGAAVFPIMVGTLLVVASLAVLWEGWRMDRAEEVGVPAGADAGRLLILIGLLFGYLLALPWLGQLLSSLLFACLFMRMLSPVSWARSIFYGAVMAGLLYFAFVVLLKVQMPRGVLLFW